MSLFSDLERTLAVDVSTPYEKLLMYVLGMLFIISGVYEISLYPNGLENRGTMEGLFILIISFSILSGDITLDGFRPSLKMSVLGSAGIFVSVMGLLVPTVMSDIIGNISAIILFIYALLCIMMPIFNKDSEDLIFRSLCIVLGILLFIISLSTADISSLKDYRTAGIVLMFIGIVLVAMAIVRKKTFQHDKWEFPVISLTMLLTGISLFCCVIASVVSKGDMNIFSMKGSMAVFMMAIGVKIISVGGTPVGTIRRSRFAISIGMFCIFVTMLAAIIPDSLIVNLVSCTLGIINIIGGLYIARQIMEKKGYPYRMPIKFSVVCLSMLLFGFNRLVPNVFGGDFLFLSLLLFASVMTSLGITIFTVTLSKTRNESIGHVL